MFHISVDVGSGRITCSRNLKGRWPVLQLSGSFWLKLADKEVVSIWPWTHENEKVASTESDLWDPQSQYCLLTLVVTLQDLKQKPFASPINWRCQRLNLQSSVCQGDYHWTRTSLLFLSSTFKAVVYRQIWQVKPDNQYDSVGKGDMIGRSDIARVMMSFLGKAWKQWW